MKPYSSYLFFNGNCAEAMRFYERVLGGKLELMTAGASPVAAQMPAATADKILHGRLAFSGGVLMASDWLDGSPYQQPAGFALALDFDDTDEARQIFAALADGGQVTMPLGPTFWTQVFGMLKDRWGTHWMVSGPPAAS